MGLLKKIAYTLLVWQFISFYHTSFGLQTAEANPVHDDQLIQDYSISLFPIAFNVQETELSLPSKSTEPDLSLPPVGNWEYVLVRMLQRGKDLEGLLALFRDSRMPARERIVFNVVPRESAHLYRRHNTSRNRINALRFFREHHQNFSEAKALYNVPAEIVLAILQVETNCGRFTGRERVIPRLLHLAAAPSPDNFLPNLAFNRNKFKNIQPADIVNRAMWLEETFLPHAIAAIDVAALHGLHPLELKGSSAGAIGMPQFLPGNVLRYGRDGDGDGRVNMFAAADSIHSTAYFLQSNGWTELKLPPKKQRPVLLEYNKSTPYVDTILAMAKHMEPHMRRIQQEETAGSRAERSPK